jgi:hypothetical protein
MNQLTSIRPVRVVAAVQSIYFLITGIWPLVHIRSFLALTGPKEDIWLVETVGVLVTAIGAGLGLAAYRGRVSGEIVLIAVGSGLGLAIIDAIYVALERIALIYLLDVAIEACLITAWAFCWRIQTRRQASR